MIAKTLKTMKNFVDNELNDLLESYVPNVDFISMASAILDYNDPILKDKTEEDFGCSLEEAIFMMLSIAQYIETDTTMESILPDELYDELHAVYVDLTGHSITGTNNTSGNRLVKQHRFPELRGSLDKVHFIYDKEVPEKDSRKSLEYWLRTSISKCQKNGINNGIVYSYFFKYDGISGVFEANKNHIDHVLTRKDTDTNTGSEVTHIYQNQSMKEMFNGLIPKDFFNVSDYGVKCEMYMKYDDFEEFKGMLTKKPKNHRSAASMIINTLPEEYNSEWRRFLTISPLQISSTEYVDLNSSEDYAVGKWHYVGKENDRYQYIITDNDTFIDAYENDKAIAGILDSIENTGIPSYKSLAEERNIPIDGLVITMLNNDMISVLGRSDNKNRYQVAFKFPAGIKATRIKDVLFSVGPVTGVVTPVAIIEPIVIMGNTIRNVSLSNIDKMERMDLHYDDDVMIKYDIIPTLFKDDSCKYHNGKKIVFPSNCPVCNEPLEIKMNDDSNNRTARCINPDCPCRIVGKIYNYVNKMNIEGIGKNTIADLVGIGALKSISDLYHLAAYKVDIIKMPGYGETKYNNIMKGINSKLVVYPHEFIGSLGIPDIGRRVMKKICTNVNFIRLLNQDPDVINNLCSIDGVSEKTVNKLCDGILYYKEVIDNTMKYLSFKSYEDEVKSDLHVLFSKVRDKDFEALLKEKYNAEIQSGYNKETNLLIVPDANSSSTKIDKARKDGKTILSLEEAKKKYHD